MPIGSRSFARVLVLVLCTLACACKSSPPAPPTIAGTWATEMRYPAGAPRGGSVFVEWTDPAGAADIEHLAGVLYSIAERRGYSRAEHPSKADYVCCLGVRYFGRTPPPGGTSQVVAEAGAEITGGHPEWIDCDRSGPDMHVAPVTTVPVAVRDPNYFKKVFVGAPAPEWALVLDVAVGARDREIAEAVQRNEGRLWASVSGAKTTRADAIAALKSRVEFLLERALP